MKPGRELDALIAEKVMRWNREHDECGLPPGVYGSDNIQPFPHYSTDISAAWEVVEKICPSVITPETEHLAANFTIVRTLPVVKEFRNGNEDIPYKVLCDNVPQFVVSVYLFDIKRSSRINYAGWPKGETLPHAICLSALRLWSYDPIKSPNQVKG